MRPKSPSLNIVLLQQQPPATTAVCPADRPTVTVPEFTGAFPAVWTAIFIAMFSTPTLASPGSPFILAPAQKHFVWLFLIYLSVFFSPSSSFNHHMPWNNLKQEASTAKPADGVKVHMEPPDSSLDLEGRYLQKWFVSPQPPGPVTQSLSVETEKHGISHTFSMVLAADLIRE